MGMVIMACSKKMKIFLSSVFVTQTGQDVLKRESLPKHLHLCLQGELSAGDRNSRQVLLSQFVKHNTLLLHLLVKKLFDFLDSLLICFHLINQGILSSEMPILVRLRQLRML